jgi:hypothetical protein
MGLKLRILPIRLPRNGTPPHRPIWKGYMTKDFNEQRRGDARPSSRNQSSSRNGEERSPHSARPRLNRASVDRAWESGARREHADYRTRSRDGQPPRDDQQRNRYGNSPSAQNGRRPYNNQQNNSRRFERTPNDNHNPRSRSFDSTSQHFDDRRSSDRRNYSDKSDVRYSRSRPGSGFRENGNYRDQRPPYRTDDRDRNRDDERRGFDRENRRTHSSTINNRQSRDFQQSNPRNPRWRSRPIAQSDDQPRRRQDFDRHEHFEGDYERFETPNTSRPRRPFNRSKEGNTGKEREELHVTRLPDGRVLKGPRPVQRKNAQFWTEIADDVEDLIEPIDASVPEKKVPSEDSKPTATRKERVRAEGSVDRGKKDKTRQSKAKSRSTGPKPSKRGFKWPKPQE